MPRMRMDFEVSESTGLMGEPVRQSSWEFVCAELLGARLVAVSISLPTLQAEPIDINYFNEKLKIASAPSVGDVTFTVRDVIQPAVAQQCYEWYRKVYDPNTGFLGFASEYKKRGGLLQYDSKGFALRGWTLYGLWPTSINFGQGDYATKEPINIEMTFSADRAIPDFFGLPSLTVDVGINF